ncbi:class I SAM-dependent methyltransferase [Sphingomonas sp. ID0503]|uniref:class I SAM-dependent methyltransferase n=1 Tax=Sphingomonas sp. ID0503 TaxID=3399691 RepID=UPI003AFA4FB3
MLLKPPALLAAIAVSLAVPAAAAEVKVTPAIAAAVAGPARTDADKARDRYRHPAETLSFFEVKPGQSVVELYPGGGWFTRIIAPLEKTGQYTAVVGNEKSKGATEKMLADLGDKVGATKVVVFDGQKGSEFAPAGTVDRVLTFRNIHNLVEGGQAEAFFAAAYKALKRGGQLGIEEHRLPESAPAERETKSGYMKISTVYRLATAAGFTLVGSSEINANPKDTADWPQGVWTLPPVLELGDKDREKYLAIGESDRMTLRFEKK